MCVARDGRTGTDCGKELERNLEIMLVHLHVKNLALIEDIEVEFGPG